MTPEEKSAPVSAPESALLELRRAYYSLRTMVHLLALCGIVLSGTVLVYLFNELALVRARNEEMARFVSNYQTKFVPMEENARANLQAFSRANPTLAPILQKHYGTNLTPRP